MNRVLTKSFISLYMVNVWLENNPYAKVVHLREIRGLFTLSYKDLPKPFDWNGYTN